jgi:hypothetical protein
VLAWAIGFGRKDSLKCCWQQALIPEQDSSVLTGQTLKYIH